MKLPSACLVLGAAMALTAPVWAQSKAIPPAASAPNSSSAGTASNLDGRRDADHDNRDRYGNRRRDSARGRTTSTAHSRTCRQWPADRAVAVQFAAPAEGGTQPRPGSDRRHESAGKAGAASSRRRRLMGLVAAKNLGQAVSGHAQTGSTSASTGATAAAVKLDAERWPDIDGRERTPVEHALCQRRRHGGGRYATRLRRPSHGRSGHVCRRHAGRRLPGGEAVVFMAAVEAAATAVTAAIDLAPARSGRAPTHSRLGRTAERRLGLLLDLVERHAGRELDQRHAAACLSIVKTPRSVITMSTTPAPVSGRVQRCSSFGSPSLRGVLHHAR